jgi:hypothetical protein
MIIRSNIQDKGVIKNSLFKQIEVLIELINTVKIKIGLIQQTEENNVHHFKRDGIVRPVK